jgi:DNA end-binding protein Ku
MKHRNMVGLGRVVPSRRERIVMLEPLEKGLMATTLRYTYEIRDVARTSRTFPQLNFWAK